MLHKVDTHAKFRLKSFMQSSTSTQFKLCKQDICLCALDYPYKDFLLQLIVCMQQLSH